MILVAGLGNPGKQYEKSRHNVGFFTIDAIRKYLDCSYSKEKNYEYFDYRLTGSEGIFRPFSDNLKIKFVRPLTYMNLSGEIFKHFKGEKIDELIVICDNIDLKFAKVRFKYSGSSAGHNGLKSIIANYNKGADFYRLYIGCGRKENMNASQLVLCPFDKEEEKSISCVCESCAKIVLDFLKNGDEEKVKQLCSRI